MQFARFLLAAWTEHDAAHQRRISHAALEQVRYAAALGGDAVWIAEPHSSRYGIFPSLMPLLAHLAAQTTTIRLGAGVSVLPGQHPIRLAEAAAMVDGRSDGRLNFGVGRGSADYEYGKVQIACASRDTRCQEALDSLLGLWTTEAFTAHGHD
jgi:alkanesulfonate monooxygenase SsuD/methylene tetrahydromethanopterin reductase-like flavin-dependent oxidoreductase (luciferase family)